jgi:AhpD family alkylhydroperoxidase
MTERLNYTNHFPEGVKAMMGLSRAINSSGLEPSLMELVKIRASQMNACSFCIDMHTKDARANGETEQRIYALSAWREAPFFSPRERAALAWTEALTDIQSGHAPDSVYDETRQQFDDDQLVKLTFAITQINAWNRIAIGFRMQAGGYQPVPRHATAG